MLFDGRICPLKPRPCTRARIGEPARRRSRPNYGGHMVAESTRQALVCPACASSFIEFFASEFGPALDMPETPATVTCTGRLEHRYPVLQVDTTPDGERLYTLGPEITGDQP